MATTPSGRSVGRVMSALIAATVLAVLPQYLAAALVVEIGPELAFGTAGLGVAVAGFRVTTSLTSMAFGALTDRLGGTLVMRIGVIVVAVSCFGIATTARSFASFLAWMIIAGAAVSLVQPAANRVIVNVVSVRRQGLVFGAKQSAVPASSMLAGVAVAMLLSVIGWRAVYILAAVISLAVIGMLGRRPAKGQRPAHGKVGYRSLTDRPTLWIMGVAFGTGNFANAVMPTFYVDAAVRMGASPGLAGTVLALAGTSTIIMRLVVGAVSDRIRHGHLHVCGGLMVAGAGGLVVLATNDPRWMVAGLLLGMTGAWGFTGVFWYALMRAYRATPGLATGVVSPLGHIGGTVGPLAFGVIASTAGFRAGWLVAAAAACLSASAMFVSARRLDRRAGGEPAPSDAPA